MAGNIGNTQMNEEREYERNRVKTTFMDTVGLETKKIKPQNVIVFGVAGTGKSSFLNTAMTSLSDRRKWYERSQVGSFMDARQSTLHLVRYTRENYISDQTERLICFPTFYDIAGLEDENSFAVKEMIRVILFGKLGTGESLQDLKQFIDECNGNKNKVRRKYHKNPEKDRIDRIVFLASARKEIPLPLNLMEAVLDVAHSSEIVIPTFGVVTHVDLVDDGDKEFRRKEKLFKEKLGLPDNRYLRCQSYCDAYDKIHGTNRINCAIPEIDIPVINFMSQICSPDLVPPESVAVYYTPPMFPDIDLGQVSTGIVALIAMLILAILLKLGLDWLSVMVMVLIPIGWYIYKYGRS